MTLTTTEVKRMYTWVIEEFSMKTGKIRSPTFNGPTDRTIWFLELYPDGDENDDKGFIAVYLHLQASPLQVNASYGFQIVNKDCELNVVFQDEEDTFMVGTGWGPYRFLPRSEAIDESKGYLIDDKLTIKCEIKVENPRLDDEKYLSKLETLFKSNDCNDCDLITGDGNVPACKALLSSQSQVFFRMFQSNSKEAQLGQVEIGDCNVEVLEELVRFASCGKVEYLADMAEDLLTAADKYEILPLVELCAQYLADTLNNENVCARLVLADRHHITKLKSAAINFIKENVRDIKAMIGYKELFATHHDLVIEIMEIMCISK